MPMTQEHTITAENLAAYGRGFRTASIAKTWTPGMSLPVAFEQACAAAGNHKASQFRRALEHAVQRAYFPDNQLGYSKSEVTVVLTELRDEFNAGTEEGAFYRGTVEKTASVLGLHLTQN